jgi:hypothetical protein
MAVIRKKQRADFNIKEKAMVFKPSTVSYKEFKEKGNVSFFKRDKHVIVAFTNHSVVNGEKLADVEQVLKFDELETEVYNMRSQRNKLLSQVSEIDDAIEVLEMLITDGRAVE